MGKSFEKELAGMDAIKDDVVVISLPWGEDAAVCYTRRGGGNNICVLTHGHWGSRYDLEDMLLPPKDWSFISFCWPGFGSNSHLIKREHGVTVYAEFLKAFLDKLGIRKASYYGESLGGSVLLEFAILYPHMVEAMALQGAQEDGKKLFQILPIVETALLSLLSLRREFLKSGLKRYYAARRRKYLGEDPKSLLHFYGRVCSPEEMQMIAASPKLLKLGRYNVQNTNLQAAAEVTISLLELDLGPILPLIQAPTLILDGENQAHPALASAVRLYENIGSRRKSLHLISDAGHMATMLAPTECLRKMLEFFSAAAHS